MIDSTQTFKVALHMFIYKNLITDRSVRVTCSSVTVTSFFYLINKWLR